MKKLSKNNFQKVLERINESLNLFLPKMEEGNLKFKNFSEEGDIDFKTLKTSVPLKNFVFPQSETYLKFQVKDKKIKFQAQETDENEFVIFGARPCDVNSLDILDNIFLREPVDTYYKSHRDRAIIVSLACQNPETSCFCGAFGIKPTEISKSADVSLVETEDFYFWRVVSEKGEKLTTLVEDLLEDVNADDEKVLEKEIETIEEKVKNLPLNTLDLDEIEGDLQEIFDKEKMWSDLARRCLACGACTYICPTCHCYDVKDYAGSKGGERFRCWDSCMFSDFTLMAHGNPRTTQMQRVRQRFMHKLVYYPHNHNGVYSCVGCGRCIEKCPVHIDIVKVIKKLVVKK